MCLLSPSSTCPQNPLPSIKARLNILGEKFLSGLSSLVGYPCLYSMCVIVYVRTCACAVCSDIVICVYFRYHTELANIVHILYIL